MVRYAAGAVGRIPRPNSPARAASAASTLSGSITCSSTTCASGWSDAASTHAGQVLSVSQTMIFTVHRLSRRP
jgi:hypothetical protein